MAAHSLGGVDPPKPPGYPGYTIKDLFASSQCKITILNMKGLQFDQNRMDFAKLLGDALSGSTTITTVYLSKTTPNLDVEVSRRYLRQRFEGKNIKLYFR